MLNDLIKWLGFEKSTFSKKKEFEKLKKILTEVRWREPQQNEVDEFTKISNRPVVVVAITNIKELAGIVDNRLRVFDFKTPEDFISKKFTTNVKSEKDDYVIGFTDSGAKMLERKALKP